MGIFSWIGSLFSSIFKKIKPAVDELATEIGSMVLDKAIDIVKKLDGYDMKSEDKRETAYKKIKMELDGFDDDIKDSVINYAIETAVQIVKKEKK
jgi:hypothetical protein